MVGVAPNWVEVHSLHFCGVECVCVLSSDENNLHYEHLVMVMHYIEAQLVLDQQRNDPVCVDL